MGLLSKLKAAKNFVTGGGAEVRVRALSDASRGSALEVEAGARVKEGEMAVSRIYVKVRATEKIEFKEDGEWYRKTAVTFESEADISGAETLVAGEDYAWTGSIQIPSDASPTYNGRYCNHVWEVCAYLDKKGNDPDSGWKVINMV